MHVVEMKAVFDSPIEDVWNLITDLNNQLWRQGIKSVEIVDEKQFIEHDKSGYSTYFSITNKGEYDVYEFDLHNENMYGHWVGKLTKINDNQVKVHFTETIEVKKKRMSLMVMPYIKKQQKQYIQDLKRALR